MVLLGGISALAGSGIASGLLSGLLTNGVNVGLTGSANQQAQKNSWQQFLNQLYLQKEAQHWQTEMSSTAHQREMADLRAAGLNPILTATGGYGASTGTAGVGSATQADTKRAEMQDLQQFVNQQDLTKAQTKYLNQQAKTEAIKRLNIEQDTELKKIENLKQTEIYKNLPKRIKAEIKNIESQVILNNLTSALRIEQQKYENERSRGFSYSVRFGTQNGFEYTGNSIFSNAKQVEIMLKNIMKGE